METAEPNKKPKLSRKRRWLKITLISLGSLVLLLLIGIVSVSIYIQNNKKEVLAKVTAKLNEDLDGKLVIKDMKPEFFSNFPRVSLRLEDVSLRDNKFDQHKYELLRASQIDITVNILALLRQTIEIKKISISDASVILYVAPDGYSNTAVFKKSDKKSSGSSTAMECNKFQLENVKFTVRNDKANKLHDFEINQIDGRMEPEGDGWKCETDIDIMARSLSFNTKRGSFIKNQKITGTFDISADGNGKLVFAEQPLNIGKENFTLAAEFNFGETSSLFAIHIKNKSIRWRDTSALLADNIREKLDMFDLEKPISVRCDLEGDFDSMGDPLIYVEAKIRNNTLTTPGGNVDKCNFDGTFANNYDKKKEFSDPNSVILLRNLTGEYGTVPFRMAIASIVNLDDPIARGKFSSAFDMSRLNGLVDKDLLEFKKGKANIEVDFTADVVNYQLTKPKIIGKVAIEKADIAYPQRNLQVNDVSVNLDFDDKDLFIRNIKVKTAKSEVLMDGKVLNFLNLYYSAPEKIVLNWNVYSKQLHLGEFLGYVGNRQKAATKNNKKTGNFTSELTELFEKSQVRMAMKIDKLYYKKFLATNTTAIVAFSDETVTIRNTGLNHAGGRIRFSGDLRRGSAGNSAYSFQAFVESVDVRKFFNAFENFGMETLKSDNISGKLSLQANLGGRITPDNRLQKNSMDGKASFTLKNGSLVNFEPIQTVGKIAFRRRDVKNITFADLNGAFEVKGEKVTVAPMKINSNVLNMDLAGVYSFGKGTNLKIDVPLRNPKRDEDITDKEELERRRHRGIVLHLLASDDAETGKIKIGLTGKNSQEETN
ncbi:MAG: AsmA family protein [Flavobacterium sp.]|uniref:AsmA family protein n=1 Tax=Flavobacterium sp. TaxID=239 RepID=UPI0011FA0152|nr:AsmA-like C-terminal region-containing protein [Flavobacterium sp.]RZJ66852.1 MAG: AsmA family protein [Flavobacterium sp.]